MPTTFRQKRNQHLPTEKTRKTGRPGQAESNPQLPPPTRTRSYLDVDDVAEVGVDLVALREQLVQRVLAHNVAKGRLRDVGNRHLGVVHRKHRLEVSGWRRESKKDRGEIDCIGRDTSRRIARASTPKTHPPTPLFFFFKKKRTRTFSTSKTR